MTTFNINPTKYNPFLKFQAGITVKVCVFDSRQDMYSYFDKYLTYGEIIEKPNYLAIVKPEPDFCNISKEGDMVDVVKTKMATMLFCKERLGGALVNHESVHAALAALRNLKQFPNLNIEDCDNEEEKLAYTIQEISRAIYDKFYKLNIW